MRRSNANGQMVDAVTPPKLESSTWATNSTNGTSTPMLGSFDTAAEEVRARLAQVDAAAGPGGLIFGGIIIGLALACCRSMCCTDTKRRQQNGWQPVTVNSE